ncbi:MAG: dienelactone hydrolase family protein [Alphaproteobacteria bacterium]|nr:dienelactone hydrolase family protein [Alphaproteobacteria bacterium]
MNNIFHNTNKHLPSSVSSAVILLHGYGSDGNDLLLPFTEAWGESLPHTALIAPNGLIQRPVFGYEWFRLTHTSEEEITNGVSVCESLIMDLLAAVRDELKLTNRRIALLGFSQGAVVALHNGLLVNYEGEDLGGVVAISGALPGRKNLNAQLKHKPPVRMIHGALDPVVPSIASELGAQALAGAGVPVELTIEPNLAHAIGPEGFAVATRFLQQQFA